MPRPGLIPARNHWCLHNDQLAQEFDGILNLTQTFPGCRKAPEGAVFYAPLSSNLNELVGGYAYDYERQLEALYERTPGQWRIAAEDVPRFESGRLLMEPAETNKCENWNANPDASLTGIDPQGATVARVYDPDQIASAGLQNVCTSGYLVRLSNETGSNVFPNIFGPVGNLNVHYSSVWANGYGASFQYGISSSGQRSDFLTDTLARISRSVQPSNAANNTQWRISPGEKVDFVLNQLEESPVLTTPIITRGASASRALDVLSYADLSQYFNQSAGVAVCDYVARHRKADISVATIVELVSLSSAGLLYAQQSITGDALRFLTFDGTNVRQVEYDDAPVYGERFRVVNTWSGSSPNVLRIGAYRYSDAAWIWSGDTSYVGAFPSNNVLDIGRVASLPLQISNVQLYDEYKDPSWVEDNLTP